MAVIANQIRERLHPLIGLRLSIARRAADMRVFHFGNVRAVPNGSVGEFALHIQCPWRLDGPNGIVTGSADLYEPVNETKKVDDTWHYDRNDNLQDHCLAALLGGYDAVTRSVVNQRADLVVEDVQADDCGGAVLVLSAGYRLAMFPDGVRHEQWRLFQPGSKLRHVVVSPGSVCGDSRSL